MSYTNHTRSNLMNILNKKKTLIYAFMYYYCYKRTNFFFWGSLIRKETILWQVKFILVRSYYALFIYISQQGGKEWFINNSSVYFLSTRFISLSCCQSLSRIGGLFFCIWKKIFSSSFSPFLDHDKYALIPQTTNYNQRLLHAAEAVEIKCWWYYWQLK